MGAGIGEGQSMQVRCGEAARRRGEGARFQPPRGGQWGRQNRPSGRGWETMTSEPGTYRKRNSNCVNTLERRYPEGRGKNLSFQ